MELFALLDEGGDTVVQVPVGELIVLAMAANVVSRAESMGAEPAREASERAVRRIRQAHPDVNPIPAAAVDGWY